MNAVGTFILAVVALAGIGACKPSPDSTLRSLDEFAGGKSRKARCSALEDREASYQLVLKETPSFESIVIVQDKSQEAVLRKQVTIAASAVPAAIRRLFMRFGGQINVIGSAAQLCSQILNADENTQQVLEGMDTPRSCLAVAGSGGKQAAVSIIVPSNPEAIDTELVRAFGYFVAQHVGRIVVQNQAKIILDGRVNDAFAGHRGDVTQAFLTDLQRSRTFSMRRFKPFFRDDGLTVVKRNVSAGRAAFTDIPRLAKLPAAARALAVETFEAFTFAEAFDSWHCNSWGAYDKQTAADVLETGVMDATAAARLANGRALMRDFFPRSYAAFGALIPRLNSQILAAATYMPGKRANASARGLSLQDGAAPLESYPATDAGGSLSQGSVPITGDTILGPDMAPQPFPQTPSDQGGLSPSNALPDPLPGSEPFPSSDPFPGTDPVPGTNPAPGADPIPGADPVPGSNPNPGMDPASGGNPSSLPSSPGSEQPAAPATPETIINVDLGLAGLFAPQANPQAADPIPGSNPLPAQPPVPGNGPPGSATLNTPTPISNEAAEQIAKILGVPLNVNPSTPQPSTPGTPGAVGPQNAPTGGNSSANAILGLTSLLFKP